MKKTPEPGLLGAHGRQRFFHYLSLGMGALALVSAVLTYREMKSLQLPPGEDRGEACKASPLDDLRHL